MESAVVAFSRRGRYVTAVGGLLAPEELKEPLLNGFMAFARLNGLIISFFNIGDEELSLFRDGGFQITKLGEDALVPLDGRTWSGGQYEWVRRQSNYCRKHGLSFTEVRREEMDEADWGETIREMQEVSHLHLLTKPQKNEMKTFEGQLHADHLGRKRIFISRSEGGTGRIEGFVLCNPCLGGTQWAIEMYRQRPGGVRGVIPFLIHQTMKRFAEEGVHEVSLCLVPTLNVKKLHGDSRFFRTLLKIWWYFGNGLFDNRGLYHFKSRFRPTFEPRYVCGFPKTTPGAVFAMIKAWGMFNVSPRSLLRARGYGQAA